MKRDDANAGDGVREEASGVVARAIRQKRPFHSASQEAAIGIVVAADRLRHRAAEALEPWGITVQQFNVLRILRGADPEPLPTLEVAARMVEKTPGVTRLIDRLEAKGWVSRERCVTDRRQVHCRITQAGRDLLTAVDDAVKAADDALAEEFTADELRALIGLVSRVIEPAD